MIAPEKLREYVHARPFKPFKLYLTDGRELKVPHPDFIAISPSGRAASVFLENHEHHLISLLLVTGLGVEGDPHGSTTPPPSSPAPDSHY